MMFDRRKGFGRIAFGLSLIVSTFAMAEGDGAGGKAPGEYSIHLSRPDKVGDRYTITAKGALVRETAMQLEKGSRTITQDGFGIELEGSVEVLAVRPDGRTSEAALTVKRCVSVAGKKAESELIPAGKVVMAHGNEDGTDYKFKDGGEVSAEAQAALELVLSLEADDDDHNDDEVLGTLDNRKIGDEWPINAHFAAEDARNEGLMVKDEAMSGKVKLAGVEKVKDTQCLKIQGELNAREVTPPAAAKAGLPEQLKPAGGSVKYRFTLMLPTDEKLGSMSEVGSLRMVSAYTGRLSAAGPEVRIETLTQRAVQVDRRPEK